MQSPHPSVAAMVRRLGSRSPLAADERQALLDLPFVLRRVDAGAHLVRDGDVPEHCCLILTGFACRYKITGEGARQIVSFHFAGEYLDLQNSFLEVSDHSVQTLTPAAIAVIPLAAIREVALSRPAVARAFWIETLINASLMREWLVNVGRRDSRARIAHLLCEFWLRMEAADLAEGFRFELPMTQEQIADALGLTAVHVNRVLKQLGEDGLIRRERRVIAIADWAGLREAGDFNERYLHLAVNPVSAR